MMPLHLDFDIVVHFVGAGSERGCQKKQRQAASESATHIDSVLLARMATKPCAEARMTRTQRSDCHLERFPPWRKYSVLAPGCLVSGQHLLSHTCTSGDFLKFDRSHS